MPKYFLWRDRAEQFPVVLGDTANSAWQFRSWPDAMRGCILPRMHAVKLVPRVWEDENDWEDPLDTRLWTDLFLQMVQYAPMAEGFLGTSSSLGQECDISTDIDPLNPIKLYDYTIPEWCRQAFGKRFFEFLLSKHRSDGSAGAGAGPLPGVLWEAEQFNQFAQGFNMLTKARIELPLILESREVHTNGVGGIDQPDHGGGGAETELADGQRVSGAGGWIIWTGQPPTTGESSLEQDWFVEPAHNSTVFQGRISYNIGNMMQAQGGLLYFVGVGSEIRTTWRIKEDQYAYLALPEDLRSILATQASLLVKIKDQVVTNSYSLNPGGHSVARTTEIENGVQIGQTPFLDISGGWGGLTLERVSTTTRSCILSGGGFVQAVPPSSSALVFDNGRNYGLVTSLRTVWPIGDQIGSGNLYVNLPVAGIEIKSRL